MSEFQSLNDEVGRIWDANADFWNDRMGEGNGFHKQLIEPSQLRLLALKRGDHVLDVACGNGQFARKMVEGLPSLSGGRDADLKCALDQVLSHIFLKAAGTETGVERMVLFLGVA